MLDEMNNKKNVHAFNILLLGERESGRRSLILRFTDNTFNSQNFGIPWEYKTKTLNFDDKIIHCTLWIYHPGPGGEGFKKLYKYYIQKCEGIVITYDMSNKSSFEKVKYWIEEVELYSSTDRSKILVGNKCDKSEKEITEEEGKNLADEFNMHFFETSAKTGYNVNEAFEFLVLDILKNKKTFDKAEYRLKKDDNKDKNNKNNNCIK